jgi:hypothetical protein
MVLALFRKRGVGFPDAFVWLSLFPRVPVPEIELFTAA